MKRSLNPLILSLAMLAICPAAHAMKKMVLDHEGGRVGNGGGLVVCRNVDQSIRSVELLDYYEARTQRNFHLELSTLSGDWKARTKQLIDRLQRLSPLRQHVYREWLERFDGEVKFLKDVQFSTIPDSGYIAVPKGCEFEQGVIQTAPRFAGDKRYFVNDELWQAMDDSQRAGLLLHEFLYREAMGYGQEDSISVQYLSGYIADENFKNVTLEDWIRTLQQARYEMTDYPFPKLDESALVDVSQIWRPAPGEAATDLDLPHTILISLGLCSEGCRTYTPYPLTPESATAAFSSFISPMNLSIQYDRWTINASGTRHDPTSIQISGPNILSIGENHADPAVRIPEGKPSLILPRSGGGSYGAFSTLEFNNDQSGDVYVSKVTTPLFYANDVRIGESISPVVVRTTFCDYYEFQLDPRGFVTTAAWIPEDQPILDPVSGQRCVASSPASLEVSISRNNEDINAMIDLKSGQTASMATFDQNGDYLSGGDIAAFWQNRFSYLCEGGRGCMTLIRGSGLESPVFETHSEATFNFWMGDVLVATHLGPQTIELYPSGAPKSVVIQRPVTIPLPTGTSRTFDAGATVYFNSDGAIQL